MTSTFLPGQPPWQVADLETLSQEGELSGINPVILSAIGDFESGWEIKGAGVNSSGYGGFYGLGVGSKYAAGTPSQELLEDPSEQSFQQQSVIAASEFASLLTASGGDPVAADSHYVGGPSGEQTLIEQALGGGSAGTPSSSPGVSGSTGSASATDAALNANPFDLFGIPQTIGGSAASAVWGEIGPFLVKGFLVITGLALIVLGLYAAAKPEIKEAAGDVQQGAQAAAVAA